MALADGWACNGAEGARERLFEFWKVGWAHKGRCSKIAHGNPAHPSSPRRSDQNMRRLYVLAIQ
ncbi:hypothetical protein NKH33_22335 [Mesorhizobium sp. M1182]|uniref:hypothetical protein n=1 Tax=Mesorhizobium sp. M1182 TaxID=2957067 RepID=UPI00333D5D7F